MVNFKLYSEKVSHFRISKKIWTKFMVIHHKVSPFAILTKIILHADYDDKTHFEIFPFLRFFRHFRIFESISPPTHCVGDSKIQKWAFVLSGIT